MMESKPPAGTIGWHDLTVSNAETIRDFYRAVVGWHFESVPMGDYKDYSMLTAAGECTAGICHSRGGNADLPPQWLMYIHVDNIDQSLREVRDGGGEIVAGPKKAPGYGRYAVIRDPAGAVCTLFEAATGEEESNGKKE